MLFRPDEVITDLGRIAQGDIIEADGSPYICVNRCTCDNSREFRRLYDDSAWPVLEEIMDLSDSNPGNKTIVRVDSVYYCRWNFRYRDAERSARSI